MDSAQAIRISPGQPALEAGPISVRRVATVPEYRECEDLQQRVWGEDDIVGVPLLDLVTAQDNGGLVLGAFDGRGHLLGFVYSFLGLAPAQRLKHCSIILAVDPRYQGMGIGYQLKLAQRSEVLAQGINLITWTFDPLQSHNAFLNIRKLGTLSSTYLVDAYGAGEGLNAGLETDRLLVEWWLRGEAPSDPGFRTACGPPVNTVRHHRRGLPVCVGFERGRHDPVLAVEIPPDISAVKASDMGVATGWRQQTREIFLHYFDRGYVIRDFEYARGKPGSLPKYLLVRDAEQG